MKESFCTITLFCLLLTTGCSRSGMISNLTYHHQNDTSSSTIFVSGMGCSNPNCTDPSHHHDCSPDCQDYEHHHNCSLDCTEASHHHNNTSEVSELDGHHQNKHHSDKHH